MPGLTDQNDRILFDELSVEAQEKLLDDLVANAGVPTPECLAFFAERREKGLGVGMVDGKLMRALSGGRMEEIVLDKTRQGGSDD